MKKYLFIFLLTILTITPSQAQTKKIVKWDAAVNPNKCCSNYMRDNLMHTAYTSKDLDYLIVLDDQTIEGYFTIYIAVQNKSASAATVDPSKFSIRFTEPVNVTVLPADVSQIAAKIRGKGKLRSILSAAAAGMRTKQSTAVVTDDQGNTSNVRITERDDAALERNRAERQSAKDKNNAQADLIVADALAHHTLFEGESITGTVHFKKPKTLAPGLILSFEIENTIYEIPYGKEREKLSATNK
jgi:hypothetical protein